jgi:hypothetical protein
MKNIMSKSTTALPSVQTSRTFSAAVIVPSPVTLEYRDTVRRDNSGARTPTVARQLAAGFAAFRRTGRREAACRHQRMDFSLLIAQNTSVLAQSNNALAANVRTSGIDLCPSHGNEGNIVVDDIVLPTVILVIAVVGIGGFLLYIFSWQRRR